MIWKCWKICEYLANSVYAVFYMECHTAHLSHRTPTIWTKLQCILLIDESVAWSTSFTSRAPIHSCELRKLAGLSLISTRVCWIFLIDGTATCGTDGALNWLVDVNHEHIDCNVRYAHPQPWNKNKNLNKLEFDRTCPRTSGPKDKCRQYTWLNSLYAYVVLTTSFEPSQP